MIQFSIWNNLESHLLRYLDLATLAREDYGEVHREYIAASLAILIVVHFNHV